jgi:hypothetical protein
MSSGAALEAFLATRLVDPQARQRFAAHPQAEARQAGLTEEECRSMQALDLDGLETAAHSFARKRAQIRHRSPSRRWWRYLTGKG